MSIRMRLYASNTQATTTLQNCEQQIAAYQAVQQAAEKFVADTESLKGAAYTAARLYYSSVLLPLAKGAELYVEAVKSAMKKLPEEYQAKCYKDLDDEELKQQIREQEGFIANLQLQHHELSRSSMPTVAKKASLSAMVELIRGHQANKRALEDLLQRLLEFNAYSPQIFSEADALQADLQTGLYQSQNGWDSAKKTFIISKDLQWAKNLSAKHATMVEERSFVQNLQVQYGFDLETANSILELKRGIDKKFPDKSQEEKDYILLLIIGRTNDNSSMWDATAGDLKSYFQKKSPIEKSTDFMSLEEIMIDLGLSKTEAQKLHYNLRLQHEMSGMNIRKTQVNELKKNRRTLYESYKQKVEGAYERKMTDADFDQFWNTRLSAMNGKNDFTHQSITMATYLRPEIYISDVYGGKWNVERVAGWKGDTTTAAFATPSMGADDYKADLDAVNLINRMRSDKVSYLQATNNYYTDLTKGRTNRASEFLEHEKLQDVKKTIFDYMAPNKTKRIGPNIEEQILMTEDESKDYLKRNYEDSYNFIRNLEEENNEFHDYVGGNNE